MILELWYMGSCWNCFLSSLCKVNIVPRKEDAEVCREMSRFSNVLLTHVLSFLCANYKVSTETKEIVFLNLKYSFFGQCEPTLQYSVKCLSRNVKLIDEKHK